MPRLTLVNRFAYPDDAPTARLMQELAEAVAAARPGTTVRILAGNRRYQGGADALPASETRQGVRIERLPLPPPRKGLLARALSYLSFYWLAFFALLSRLERGEIVICMTDPPMFYVPAAWAARWRGAKLVNWVQDLYPDVVQSAGMLGRSPLVRLLFALRRSAYRHSAALVALGEGMRDRLRRDGGSTPVEIIPNWADGDRIRPRDVEELPLRREWLPQAGFVVGYFGNLGFAHNYHSMLAAAEKLKATPAVQLLWVGEGSRRVEFQQRIATLGLDNVHWCVQQPFERMPELLGIADLHLVMLDPQFDEVLVPSKTYVALAAGRPLLFLGNPGSELARLVREHDVGVAVAQDDVEGIVTAINILANDPARCAAMGQRARDLFDARFERSHAIRQWLVLLDHLGCAEKHTDGNVRSA